MIVYNFNPLLNVKLFEKINFLFIIMLIEFKILNFMNEEFISNNNFDNDKFVLNSEESDFDNLITRLKEIKATISLLEKNYLNKS